MNSTLEMPVSVCYLKLILREVAQMGLLFFCKIKKKSQKALIYPY